MESRRKIWFAISLTLFFLLLGTVGYSKLEGFSLLDAFYMTVITISTVGFGEINQLSGVGRIFTIFLILSGVGSVAFAAHAFTESIIERASNPQSRLKAMKKKIERLKKHTIICGHGRVGAAAADHFFKKGKDFVVVEYSEEELKILEEKGYPVLFGDATSESTLLDAGIKRAGALLALLDSDPENLFTVLTARDLNPTLHIIARTEVASSETRILRAGADAVIFPYAAAGRRVADKILGAEKAKYLNQNEYVDEPDGQTMVLVDEESGIEKLTVAKASEKLKTKVIGLRRGEKDHLLPADEFILEKGDELLLATKTYQQHGAGFHRKKIVLVDDNPVIRRLYTRLFQKAGYNILTAENGERGLALIMDEQPDVAVIDYMLPDITGLEVCRRLSKQNDAGGTKLILFTSDEQDKTRAKAHSIGIDKVVVKSPEASEIISIVKDILG